MSLHRLIFQTEDQARWRGAHLLEALAAHQNRQLTWTRLTGDQFPRQPRGIFDPATQRYDTEAGPSMDLGGPAYMDLVIHSNPVHPGEVVTLTPSWLDARGRELGDLGLADALREYAQRQLDPNTRSFVAAYWPSRKRVMWANGSPHALRTAARHLAWVEPMNAQNVRAYARLAATREAIVNGKVLS